MGHLFPVNPVSKSKSKFEIEAIERITEEEKQFKDNQNDHNDNFDQLEEKVNKLINDKKIMETINLSGLDITIKSNFLQLAKYAATSLLKKELVNIVKSIISISEEVNVNVNDDDINEENLSFSDYLARLIMKLAINKKNISQESVNKKLKKPNVLKDKNAGFLVHYCKNILNQKIRQQKNKLKLDKLNKKDIIKYLKK